MPRHLSSSFTLSFFFNPLHGQTLIEEANDLPSNVLSPCLLVVHNTGRCGKHDVAELTRWQQLHDPLLEVREAHVVAGGDDTGLVDAAVELDDDLAGAVVIDFFEFANVAFVEICQWKVQRRD